MIQPIGVDSNCGLAGGGGSTVALGVCGVVDWLESLASSKTPGVLAEIP